MKIKKLSWEKPDVTVADEEDGWSLAWQADPHPEIKYQVTYHEERGNFESWFLPEDREEENEDHESVTDAKRWCEEHWDRLAKESILFYAEIEEGDLR